jgi:hypothetical protein
VSARPFSRCAVRCAAQLALGISSAIAGGGASAYPLDGVEQSGIRRLEGYALAQQQPTGAKLPAGALLSGAVIQLGLVGRDVTEFDTLPQDAALAGGLNALFESRDASYAAVLLDISDPNHIRWAGIRPDTRQNVGSVGKILCMIALFDGLARAFPEVEARARVLRETMLHAGEWVLVDEHKVPRFDAAQKRNTFALLKAEDEFRLSEWLDHAISASANGAGAVVWREAMLLRHFGSRYPVSWEESEAFFRATPKAELAALAQQVIVEPLEAAGIDTANIQQGSFWTRTSQRLVPGGRSFATPRELARVLFRLEQGRLVDAWSSLEMKKYLYMTKRRYRYAYAPELAGAAVYFKSGSLYSCRPEEGYRCRQYAGNDRNYMNSVVTIESPAGPLPEKRYIVTLLSNVLRYNSAWDHSRFAAAIQEMVLTRAPVEVREQTSAQELDSVGRSD